MEKYKQQLEWDKQELEEDRIMEEANKLVTLKLIVAFVIVIAVGFLLVGCTVQEPPFGKAKDYTAPKNKHLKLKTTKDKILVAVDGIDENGKQVKSYKYIDYKLKQKKIKKDGVDYDEDVSMRTYNTRFFKPTKGGAFGAAATTTAQLVRVYAPSFYYTAEEWYYINTATTTIADYEEQTATTTAEAIKAFFGFETAIADTVYSAVGDGNIYYNVATAWDIGHDATSGSGGDYTGTLAKAYTQKRSDGKFNISRAFFPFDTSGLPSDTILSASFNYWQRSDCIDYAGTYSYIATVQTDQASISVLALNGDYNNCGATNNPTEGAAQIDIGSITCNDWNEIPLNATGIGWIDDAGNTKLGFRIGYDTEDVAVPTTGIDVISFTTTEYNGTADCGTSDCTDPYLEVTYSPPAPIAPPANPDIIWL